MIERPQYEKAVYSSLERSPVTAVLGPRQCGKTTLCRRIAERENAEYFDLEDEIDAARLRNPKLTLSRCQGLIVIDEIQRKPELFSVLRVLADDPDFKARALILGSVAPHVIKNVSESLAGRVAFVDMSPFSLDEIGIDNLDYLWFNGGFPRAFLAKSYEESFEWRRNFIRTFLERDIPQLGITIPAETLRRFWTMLAHYHGQIWNASEFARSLGASEPTARKYLDILSGTYVVRQLQPWHENISKRQVKSPKIYIRDSGLLHALLSLKGKEILAHQKLGASWEGFIIDQILAKYRGCDFYYWKAHTGAELDLLLFINGKRIGFEVKYADAPSTTKSMHSALETLGLDKLYIIYPGGKTYPLTEKIEAMPITGLFLL